MRPLAHPWFGPGRTPDAARRGRRCPVGVGSLEGRMLLSGAGDVTPPHTVAAVSGVAGGDGYFRSPVAVRLSATDVDDPASTLTTFTRVNGGPAVVGRSLALTRDGVYHVAYFSKDPAGNVEAAHTLLVRIDHTPPAVTAFASPTTLWPPNNKLVPVTVTGHVADNLSGAFRRVTFRVVDEYGRVQPGGTVPVSGNGNYRFVVDLQSSRLGQDKDGRHYVIDVTAADLAGNRRTAAVVVTVPHDQGNHNNGPGQGQTLNQGQDGGGNSQGNHGNGNQGNHGNGNQGNHGNGNKGNGNHGNKK